MVVVVVVDLGLRVLGALVSLGLWVLGTLVSLGLGVLGALEGLGVLGERVFWRSSWSFCTSLGLRDGRGLLVLGLRDG